MYIDPLAQQVGIGGVVAIGMTATVMKFLPVFMRAWRETRENGNGNGNGRLSDLQKFQIAEIVREANENHLADMRNLISSSNLVIRDLVVEVIRKERNA